MTTTDERYVIWSIEHQAWWRAAWCGYTETLGDAGLYDDEQARKVLQGANRVAVNECAIPVRTLGLRYLLSQRVGAIAGSITCLTCYRTSHHPGDVENKYCGYCHVFHEDRLP